MIYLDHNATTAMPAVVIDAAAEAMREGLANPASQHARGRLARSRLEGVRDSIRTELGARNEGHRVDRVIFTSGGTESNNLAIRGLCGDGGGQVIVSAVEHPCVTDSATALEGRGFQVIRLKADAHGVVQPERLEQAISAETKLVSVMLANHETGVIQPIPQLARICRERGVPMHTDAVQAAGKLPVSFGELGVTAMTVSAHKFHGPRGVGALITTADAKLSPLLFGGGQQLEMRPGTESIALPIGMHSALAWSRDHLLGEAQQMGQLRDRFERALSELLPDIVINGGAVARLPNTSSIAFLGVNRQGLLMALDQAGIACSTGSACASGSSEPSPVLLGMGCSSAIVESSLRFSLGPQNTTREIERAVELIVDTVRRLRG